MARDLFHENVREALLKEGWNITHDPLRVPMHIIIFDQVKNEILQWIKY